VDELQIRQATAADLLEMARVITSSFSPWPSFDVPATALEHLTWKLGPGGIDDIGKHLVVEIGGAIAASRLRWIGRARVGEQEYVTEMGADLAVDPDFQGRGIARQITAYREASEEGRGHVNFGTPTRHMQQLRDPAEDRHFHPLLVWTRYLGIRSLLSEPPSRRALPRFGLAALRRLAARVRGGAPSAEAARVEPLERFDERTDELWHRARGQFEIASVRTASYLNWRHRDRRGGSTVALAIAEAERCLGYAVFKQTGQTANVVDLLVDPERPELVGALLDAGLEQMRAGGARTLRCWLPPEHQYQPALERSGFVKTGAASFTFSDGQRLTGPPEGVERATDPESRFHVMLGDFDFV
jgi:GNAT superfamily N-acetyltransferase